MTPVLRALAIAIFIGSAGQTSTAILRRNLEFGKLQKVQIASYLVGFGVVGIPLAFAGLGVWALVFAQLTQSTSATLTSWLLVRHGLRLNLGPGIRRLLSFGWRVTGSSIVCWTISAFPNAFIGRSLGAATLGLYNRSWVLISAPSAVVSVSVQAVSLSLYSRLQNDTVTVRRAYLGILALVSMFALPTFLFVAASAGPVVQVLLGARWMRATPLFTPLGLAMALDSIALMSGPLLLSRRRPDLDLRTQVITAAVGMSALAAVGWYGGTLTAVVWTVCLAFYTVRATTAVVLACNTIGVRLRAAVRAISGGAMVGTAVYLTVIALNTALPPAASGWQRVGINLVVAATVALGALLTAPKALLTADLISLIILSGLPIPSVAHRWLAARAQEATPCPLAD